MEMVDGETIQIRLRQKSESIKLLHKPVKLR